MIERTLQTAIASRLFKQKVIVLLGARQVGKTTLLKKMMADYENVLWLNGDNLDVQEIFKNQTSTQIKTFIGNHKIVVIDEAQRIGNIGIGLKLIHDNFPEIQVVATGSSTFELKNNLNEPLTGRKFELQLFPFSTKEMIASSGALVENRMLAHRLVYGFYPEIVSADDLVKERLHILVDSYLYKDLLMLNTLKKPDKLIKLLQALAYQVGSQVSYNEIGNLIGLDFKTVETYIELLEKAFVIFRLNSFSRNLRNELKSSRKIYFYDNGICNALINNFQIAENRQDIGALWENYLVSERRKRNSYDGNFVNTYFWRTAQQQEVDYIEEIDGVIYAFEFKWSANKKPKLSTTFKNAYPNHDFKVITPENYLEFV
jgi:uncharacterized protein